MVRKRYKPEEIVGKLRQAEVLHGRGMAIAEEIRQLGISEVTFDRWRKENGGMSGDQLCRLKQPERERATAARGCRLEAGQADPGGGGLGKLLSPSQCRQCIGHVSSRGNAFTVEGHPLWAIHHPSKVVGSEPPTLGSWQRALTKEQYKHRSSDRFRTACLNSQSIC